MRAVKLLGGAFVLALVFIFGFTMVPVAMIVYLIAKLAILAVGLLLALSVRMDWLQVNEKGDIR